MHQSGRQRVVIEHVDPEIQAGRFPLKKALGDRVRVEADIFTDGHDQLRAQLLFQPDDAAEWSRVPMQPLVNDRWQGSFRVSQLGFYRYTIRAWVDHFLTWQEDLRKKLLDGQEPDLELQVGLRRMRSVIDRAAASTDARNLQEWVQAIESQKDAQQAVHLALSRELADLMAASPSPELVTTYSLELPVEVDREKAVCSAWYELFPRSWSHEPGRHGTFGDCERLLPEIARMGFDTLYLPPIHPIGRTHRKGKNNSPTAGPDEPGSPWAIGAAEGGHKAVHPDLGTLEDFQRFVRRAGEHGLEVALDLAFQCSMDHPYVAEHPEWFIWRPDGSIQYAENPPKKYQDVVPFNFETESWPELWKELKSVVDFWIEQGVCIFRVDNPHTKPFSFWEWLIHEVKREHPEVIFLAEAFTRPKVMYRLAKLGFSQSYTYFTWRNSKPELEAYLEELTQNEPRYFFRPNFWPNTPDILPELLQFGGRPAFIIRLVLAATLSSSYGIYGPAFELCVAEAVPGKEEYHNSEKYEIKEWSWDAPGNLKDLIAQVNRIRRENPALQRTESLELLESDNEHVIFYAKWTAELDNVLLIAVNLDPFQPRSASIRVPIERLGIPEGQPYLLHDLLGQEKHVWIGEWNRIDLNPHVLPARMFRIHARMRRENDFDYFQ